MADESVAETLQESRSEAPTLATVEAQAEALTQEVAALEHPAETPVPTPEPPVGTGWKKVRYLAPAGIDLPVEYADRWWHANSQHVIPSECAAELADTPGFTILGDAPEPANAKPCVGCGKAKAAATP